MAKSAGYANTGGQFVAELRHAGYDALSVTGRASVPSIIRIVDDAITVEPAPELWGKQTGQVHDTIVLGPEGGRNKGRVACIGPAGENLVRFAAIMHTSNRAAGRSGLGAVMGSKNLKAIAVRGSQPLGLADKNLMNQVVNRGGFLRAVGKPDLAALLPSKEDLREARKTRPDWLQNAGGVMVEIKLASPSLVTRMDSRLRPSR